MDLNIESTADGSATLYRNDIDEHYHSIKGALSESLHVYLDLGWRKSADNGTGIKVFEVGFGTGLNAAITARAATKDQRSTDYISVELNPLPAALTDKLIPYQGQVYVSEFMAVNNAPWDKEIEISHWFRLHKIQGNLLTMIIPDAINVVYFDAFAPEKQPEMWSEDIFSKIFNAMSPGGILTTYCAKGAIRRLLQGIGFFTERLPGPPGGKREVLRATKPLQTK